MPDAEFKAQADAVVAELWCLMEAHCVGWRGMVGPAGEIPFDGGEGLDALLADQEIWPLAVAVLAGAEPTDVEKKGPGSPSPSVMGTSAPDATAAPDA